MTDAVILDLDGTLVDSADGIVAAYQQTLKECGRTPPPRGELLQTIGIPTRQNFRAMLGDGHDLVHALARFRLWFSLEGVRRAHCYDGITAALEQLRVLPARLFVCTARPRRSAVQALQVEHLTLAVGRDAHVAHQHVRKTPSIKFPHAPSFRQGLSCRFWPRNPAVAQAGVGPTEIKCPIQGPIGFVRPVHRERRSSASRASPASRDPGPKGTICESDNPNGIAVQGVVHCPMRFERKFQPDRRIFRGLCLIVRLRGAHFRIPARIILHISYSRGAA